MTVIQRQRCVTFHLVMSAVPWKCSCGCKTTGFIIYLRTVCLWLERCSADFGCLITSHNYLYFPATFALLSSLQPLLYPWVIYFFFLCFFGERYWICFSHFVFLTIYLPLATQPCTCPARHLSTYNYVSIPHPAEISRYVLARWTHVKRILHAVYLLGYPFFLLLLSFESVFNLCWCPHKRV